MAGTVKTQGPPAPTGGPSPYNDSYKGKPLYSFPDLVQLWTYVGGQAVDAPYAAAVALAESGGDPQRVSGANHDGTRDYGLWQINQGGSAALDPVANARMALSKFTSGSAYGNIYPDNFSAWTTAYNNPKSPSNYQYPLGANSPAEAILKANAPNAAPVAYPPSTASEAGAAAGAGASAFTGVVGDAASAIAGTAWKAWFGDLSPAVFAIRTLEVVGGSILMIGGLTIFALVLASKVPGQKSIIGGIIRRGGFLGASVSSGGGRGRPSGGTEEQMAARREPRSHAGLERAQEEAYRGGYQAGRASRNAPPFPD